MQLFHLWEHCAPLRQRQRCNPHQKKKQKNKNKQKQEKNGKNGKIKGKKIYIYQKTTKINPKKQKHPKIEKKTNKKN